MSEPLPANDSNVPPLAALQHWFQAAITHPGGVAAGARSQVAPAAIADAAIDEIACGSTRQTAEERLAVYAHAYWARLLECLREEFPVLRATVGDEAFDGLAVGYLMAHPSTSYTLGKISERFPEYLRLTAVGDATDVFSELVADLACLEQSVNDAFDAPGGETLGFLTADQLDRVAADDRGTLRLALLPTVRLLAFHTNVNDVFTGMRTSAEAAPTPELRPTFVALTRRGYVVRRLSLTENQYQLLTALAAGQALNDALFTVWKRHESLKTEATLDVASIDSDMLRTWFADWARAGIFAALES